MNLVLLLILVFLLVAGGYGFMQPYDGRSAVWTLFVLLFLYYLFTHLGGRL